MIDNWKKIIHSESLPILLLIAVCFAIGLFTIHDYGEGWDEYNFFQYASESLSAYQHLFQPGYTPSFSDPTLRYYGAWFLMSTVLAAKLIPQWYIPEVAHLMTFVIFLVGVFLFYRLARRWLTRWASFGAAALFATQPVLWGHGFINARDIPFMAAFLAAVHFGLRWSDAFSAEDFSSTTESAQTSRAMRQDWAGLPPLFKILLTLLTAAGIFVIASFIPDLQAGWAARGISLADTSSARDLDIYLRPILSIFWAAMIFFVLIFSWMAMIFLPFLPNFRHRLWEMETRPYLSAFARLIRQPAFIAATLALGLVMGIRIMGFAAGGIVILHLLWKHGRKIFLPAFLYFGLAFVPVYLTWPHLWGEPLLRLLITLRAMMRFPWPGEALFDGAYYAGNELPRSYLPTLFSVQLTEPLLALAALGLGVALQQVFRRKTNAELPGLTIIWFGAPLTAAILGRPYIYDNFRQFLFILPPLFLLAGLGIEFLFTRISNLTVRIALLAAILAPGIWGMVSLHPYEYIYYNQFAGGVAGAFRRYEMDYWGTSFREAAEYLNAHAPADSQAVVWGPAPSLWRFVRKDIHVYDFRESAAPTDDFYAVMLSRNDNDLHYLTDADVQFTVEKQGALLAVIKYIP